MTTVSPRGQRDGLSARRGRQQRLPCREAAIQVARDQAGGVVQPFTQALTFKRTILL